MNPVLAWGGTTGAKLGKGSSPVNPNVTNPTPSIVRRRRGRGPHAPIDTYEGDLMRFLWPVLGLCACWYVMAQCAGESDASTTSRVAQWRLSQRPIIGIGIASGDPVYELTDAASSLRLDDGGIVVADVGAGRLRYFAAAGRFHVSTPGDARP